MSGFFETVLVERSSVRCLDRHVTRFRAAGASEEAVQILEAVIASTSRQDATRVVRVDFDPATGAVTMREREPTLSLPVRLAAIGGYFDPYDVSRTVKGTDRGWADAAEELARASGADEALLIGVDRRLAETTRANVFAILEDGSVATPPVEGILPGVTRSWVMDQVEVVERRLRIRDLAGVRGVFLTTAGRGLVSVSSIDGAVVPHHPLIDELAASWQGLLA